MEGVIDNGILSVEYKLTCEFESLSKGKGKINCVVNIPRWKFKTDALEALQEELQSKCPDAKSYKDILTFESLDDDEEDEDDEDEE